MSHKYITGPTKTCPKNNDEIISHNLLEYEKKLNFSLNKPNIVIIAVYATKVHYFGSILIGA